MGFPGPWEGQVLGLIPGGFGAEGLRLRGGDVDRPFKRLPQSSKHIHVDRCESFGRGRWSTFREIQSADSSLDEDKHISAPNDRHVPPLKSDGANVQARATDFSTHIFPSCAAHSW